MLKKQSKNELSEEAKVCVSSDFTSYTELAYRRVNEHLLPLIEKKRKNEEDERKLLEKISKGGSNSSIESIIMELRDRREKIEKEISEIRKKYNVDVTLGILASKIDTADKFNKGIDLILNLVNQINEMVPTINAIEQCYNGTFHAPGVYGIIKHRTISLLSSIEVELPKLHKEDKEKLIKEFNTRFKALEEMEKETNEMKRSILDNTI